MAVVIDGKKWDFSREKYMEEVERCNVTVDVRPQDRIHLHDKNPDTIHVHMAASTWGDLFANLSWNIGNNFFIDDEGGEYRSGSGKYIYYILNGEELILSPINTIVWSEDRLFVYYGTGTFEEVLLNYFPLVSRNATEYNGKEDPASCSSNAQNGLFSGFYKNIWAAWAQIREKLPHSHSEGSDHK